jgi:indole-3-glycerol phosphate synthase
MSLLQDIVAHKRHEVVRRKRAMPQATLIRSIDTRTRDFAGSLTMRGISLIAEIKYASPAAGVVTDQRDPITRARIYEEGGARALSVLTDSAFFNGSLDHIRIVRKHSSLPVLRKDFIIDEYQIYQSRYLGADAILIIVRLLEDPALMRFIEIAHALRMTALVEVHTQQEIVRATRAHAQCIGINNRDLDTLHTDITTCVRLRPLVPTDCVVIAESGIHTREDMQRVEAAGFHAVLIGHALAATITPEKTIRSLQGRFYDTN